MHFSLQKKSLTLPTFTLIDFGPGKVTIIVRMGAEKLRENLPKLIRGILPFRTHLQMHVRPSNSQIHF